MVANINAFVLNYFHLFLNFASHLNSDQVIWLIAITALLMLFLAYRLLGLGGVFVLSVVYLIIYTLYINNIFNLYEQRQVDEARHNQALEAELKK